MSALLDPLRDDGAHGRPASTTSAREDRLARLIDASLDAVLCMDEHQTVSLWNAAAERLFGYSAAEILGRHMDVLVPETARASHNAGFDRFISTGQARLSGAIQVRALRKDGSEVDIELTLACWEEGGAPLVAGIVRDITARKATEAALVVAKQAAEAASRAKSAFLANMSHEIRTPLNGVIGVIELLAAADLNPQQAEMAGLIRTSSQQLQRLLGDVLDLARIESNQLDLTEEPFSISRMVNAVRELCSLKAEEKGIALNAFVDPSADAWVRGDEVRVKQILINLVANAVKFTARGSVSLHVTGRPGALRFEVQDTGVGFTAAQKDLIFQRFQQADDTVMGRFGGTGLGLAISRELAAAMGGSIDAEAEPGKGATFVVQLPLPGTDAQALSNSGSNHPQAQFPALEVLVADDHPTNRRVVELMLAPTDARITCVADGAAAVRAYQEQSFDVVLMDMVMPVLDGIAATRAIRAHEEASGRRRSPIVMLTANAISDAGEQAAAAGVDGYLSKPLTPAALYAMLGQVTSGAA